MNQPLANYEEQVYAAVLGKIIGVYMGRPFEGWPKHAIEEKWGQIDRYVNEDQGHDLVVSDDDITGTFTFVRALEDSGAFEACSAKEFGQTWMNYLIENKTILWWGGMGVSTEHTAYLRLKNGIEAPASGSCALNGKTVSEQIGAQIFIDAIGMCFPGEPERAAKVAAEAARVSHDGEAVYAAQIVASMVAMAFVEKDLNKVLDHCLTLIPADSMIAEIHRDVRAWQKQDQDWHQTFKRIDEKYGYHIYGGNCHVIPNHAIMVMAWAYAPDNFHQSQIIINTAGWDTDCNAANVGSVMGLICGLDGINADYDYQTPFADRVLMPTAEGSRGTSDALLESYAIAKMGRQCMGWPAIEAPNNGAWLHFSQRGALHGFRAEDGASISLHNVAHAEHADQRNLRVHNNGPTARISTPVLTRPESATGSGGYGVTGCPRLYAGYTVKAQLTQLDSDISVRMFVRIAYHAQDEDAYLVFSDPLTAAEFSTKQDIALSIPTDLGQRLVLDFGFEVTGSGSVCIEAVRYVPSVNLYYDMENPYPMKSNMTEIPGYVLDANNVRHGFSDDAEGQLRILKNQGRGIMVTGTDDWTDYTVSGRANMHLADYVGLIARYQGQSRHIELRQQGNTLSIIQHYYGEEVLASCESPAWNYDEFHHLSMQCNGAYIIGFLDGQELLRAQTSLLSYGGAGYALANGIIGTREFSVQSLHNGVEVSTGSEAVAIA